MSAGRVGEGTQVQHVRGQGGVQDGRRRDGGGGRWRVPVLDGLGGSGRYKNRLKWLLDRAGRTGYASAESVVM